MQPKVAPWAFYGETVCLDLLKSDSVESRLWWLKEQNSLIQEVYFFFYDSNDKPAHNVSKPSPAAQCVWFGWYWGLGRALMGLALSKVPARGCLVPHSFALTYWVHHGTLFIH